jgi:hypothetical protein
LKLLDALFKYHNPITWRHGKQIRGVGIFHVIWRFLSDPISTTVLEKEFFSMTLTVAALHVPSTIAAAMQLTMCMLGEKSTNRKLSRPKTSGNDTDERKPDVELEHYWAKQIAELPHQMGRDTAVEA